MDECILLLSIIIPVYNGEPYLKECLDSILRGVNDSVELIVVNDGSTDNSWAVMQTYAMKNKNILLVEQKNGGVSAARNAGLENARGRYCMFADCDDFVDSIQFRKNIQFIRNHPSELFLFSCLHSFERNESKEINFALSEGKHVDMEALHRLVVGQKLNGLWRSILRRSIIKEHCLKFNTSMFMGEDICFLLDYLPYVHEYCYIPDGYYHYRLNASSVSSNTKLTHLEQKLRVYEKMKTYIQDMNLNHELHKENERLLLHIISHDIRLLKESGVSNHFITEELKKCGVETVLKNISYQSLFDRIRKLMLLHKQYQLIRLILRIC